jgi:sugar lactone lactonase YvrE
MTEVRCIVDAKDILGETPLWCDTTQSLWWLDIDSAKLHRLEAVSGKHDTFSLEARFTGSMALRLRGGLLVALDLALHTFHPDTNELRLLCQVEPPDLDNRLNDGRCDASGRFWVGTMDNQLSRPSGALYRIDPNGSVTRMFGGVIVSNTIAISPDQKTLFFSDTRRFTIWAFDLEEGGGLRNRRVFVDYTATRERPDGACVDAEGFIWNAIFAGGRIVRYKPDGRLDRAVKLPVTNPTCLCFGGKDLETLYVTTARKFLTEEQLSAEPLAGALLAVDAGVRGLPEAKFAG